RAIKGFEGTGETVTSRGLHAVSSFKRIKSTNWILAANFPQSEAYAPIHRAKWYLLAALITVPCFSVLTVWWFMHHLTAPLLQFTRHVKAFTRREEEPRPFRVTSRDEIGTLAQTFNEMLAEMDKQKKTIREQKEFSENLLLNSAVPTFVLDSRHRVIIWNKACEELTGIKATEILGTADSWKAFYGKERPVLADIVIDGNDKELQFYFGSCSKSPFTPDGLQAEGWRRTANGRVFYAFFDTAPVRNAAGEIIAVIQTIQDITERKQMEETLRESEERYRRLVELSPDAIYIHTGGILVFANVTGAKLLGAERPEDLYGREALDFVHPDNRDLVVRRLNGLKLDGDSNPVTEEMFVRLDGSIVTVDVSSLIFIYQGKEAVLVVARDIREQKKMQEELLKAQKLESLGILAGGIAHDFNNILTGVLGNLSLANARLGPDHSIARYLGDCEKAVVQASKLTQQLLTFARGGEPVKKLIDAASLIRETASFVLRGSNVRSVIELADDLWSVEADSGQLNQALNNILINAAQSMPNGGEITVRAGNETLEPENMHQLPSGYYLRIVIEDRGCGIPSENLTRVFDPYFTTKTEGNGLGLASVYSIIKRHGGAVEVSSSVGIGSSITIHLPALPGELPEGEAVNKAPELIGNGRGRILIMDDEDFIRDIASEILEFMGYEVESCADGKEAVERFRKARESKIPYDAVILDLTIPGGMGGKEASALILKIDPHAVLIVSSGYSNDPVVANFRQHGFSGVVSKPFDANGLARELDRLIQNKVDYV
ncbi:MAG TPA: PAS domain S-box protein, partial [Geobacteraceae bacterium]|nr:PAS domain S-box protein [Geobacteraceae bacterium]